MRLRAVAALALLAACKKPVASEPADAGAAPLAASAPAAPSTASAAASAHAPAAGPAEPIKKVPTRDLASVTPPREPELDRPVVRARTSKGRLVVWGEDAEGATDLVAAFEDDKGDLAARARVLRRTSGHVAAIDVVETGTDLVVAWASSLGEGKGQVIATVTASADVTSVTPPTTVSIVAASVALQGHVAMMKSPLGGVVVAHQGPPARCTLLADGPVTECVTFEVRAVSPSGVVTLLGGDKLHGGPSPELRMLDVDGKAVVVLASSMRGGRTTAAITVPYDPTGAKASAARVPPRVCGGVASHLPELARGAGGEIVTICVDEPDAKQPCARPLRGDRDRCLRVEITAPDGAPITPTRGESPIVTQVGCAGPGRPRLSWGPRELDLVASTASVSDFAPAACRAP